MKFLFKFLRVIFLLPSLLVAADLEGRWDLQVLRDTPPMQWVNQNQSVHSLLYTGESYQGHPTDVFAFYASPLTLGEAKPGTKFPAVVLIHGGGGTAYAEWVHLWAKRGYAAIAMDLSGSRPGAPEFDPKTGAFLRDQTTRTRLAKGGPGHGHPEKFGSIGGDVSDDWPFHAAASVIRAHSLLRSFAEVDAERTAVTGISWGGYTTCLVASLDERFKAAVPVYGCGYLFEGESVQKSSIDKLGEHRQQWISAYDPSSFLPRCRVPILFVNGTNDTHYPLDSYMKSFDCVPGFKQMRVQVQMPHGHKPGWAPPEIGLFIDSYCRSGQPLLVPGPPKMQGDQVVVSLPEGATALKASLHFTTESGLRSKREWQSLPGIVSGNTITAPKPAPEANTWFLTITDHRQATVSTTVQFSP